MSSLAPSGTSQSFAAQLMKSHQWLSQTEFYLGQKTVLQKVGWVPDNSTVIDGRHLVLGACSDGMLVHTQMPICVLFLPQVPQPIRLQDIKLILLLEQLNQQHGAPLQSNIFMDDEKMPTISSRSDLVKTR